MAAAIDGATAADVAAAVETHLPNQAVPNVNVVNAVSLKLPEFNTARVEYWFVAAEAEFRIKNITGRINQVLLRHLLHEGGHN
jgi:hypothetical protein